MRPLFVMMVPLRRCGSNAIRLRMNLHPEFYSPYPLHLVDIHDKLISYGDLGKDCNYFRLINDMVNLQSMSLVKWTGITFDPVVLMKQLYDEPRSIYRIYTEMLMQAAERKGAKVIMDKCQDSVNDYQQILDLFPDMLFLDVVRDPRAQVCSMNKSIIYDFMTEFNIKRWVESRKIVDKIYQEHPSKILTIRYEDFIQDHESTMRTICNFMGIGFDPVVLNVQHSQEALHMSLLSPLWETNYSQPEPHHVNKFMHELSDNELEMIETECMTWMKKYGYEPITQFNLPVQISNETIEMDSLKKSKAWKNLEKENPEDYILRRSRLRFIHSLHEL